MLHRQEPISLNDVMKNGVAMADEVSRFERSYARPVEGSNFAKSEIGSKERNILLSIIAVLCGDLKIDYNRPAKAANLIKDSATKMGVSIGESTIEGHLKKIPEALESRTR